MKEIGILLHMKEIGILLTGNLDHSLKFETCTPTLPLSVSKVLRDQICATGIVINSSLISCSPSSSVFVIVTPDWHAPQIGTGTYIFPRCCVGRTLRISTGREVGKKGVLLQSFLFPLQRCTTHSMKVPHFLIRRRR